MFDYEINNINKVRELAHECTLFLKRDNSFPLDKPCTIAAYGNGVRNTLKGGTGSGEVNSREFKTIEEALKEANFEIINNEYFDLYDLEYQKARKKFIKQIRKDAKKEKMNPVAYGMGMVMPEMDYETELNFDADASIYVLSRICGEGNDRKNINGDFKLTHTEIRIINELNNVYDKFILVLNVGGPVDLEPVKHVKNILLLSQLGVSTSDVLIDILLGKVNPSGKLTTSWTSFENYNNLDFGSNDETKYTEGIYVGYRYFDSVNKVLDYPFGFGLSYTDFKIDFNSYKVDESNINLKVKVKNIGEFSGKETVQIYLSKRTDNIDNPYQDLVAFKKTKLLDKDEEENLEINFNLCDFSNYLESMNSYILDSGKYIVRVGNSSTNTKAVLVLELDKAIEIKKVRAITTKPDFDDAIYNEFKNEDLSNIETVKLDLSNIKCEVEQYNINRYIYDEVHNLSDRDLAKMCMGTFDEHKGFFSIIGNASRSVAGAAGETRSLEGIKSIPMADGPAGLRLSRTYYVDKKGVHSVGGNGLPESMLELLTGMQRFFFKMLVHNKKKAPKGCELKYQYATAIPIGTALAQSFNLDYVYSCGDIVGSEMEMFNVKLWLAPALNIHRSVLCGRNFEYYSEDPLVSGLIANAMTLGVQSHKNCGVTIKHFCCNNQETNRTCNNTNISERALREIYLKGFEICIKNSNPKSIMSSYNLLNGTHTSEHKGLMIDYLRGECKYDGLIMTDWTTPGYSNPKMKYHPMNIVDVIKGGGDAFMPGTMFDLEDLMDALKEGLIERKVLEESASSVVHMSRELNQE